MGSSDSISSRTERLENITVAPIRVKDVKEEQAKKFAESCSNASD